MTDEVDEQMMLLIYVIGTKRRDSSSQQAEKRKQIKFIRTRYAVFSVKRAQSQLIITISHMCSPVIDLRSGGESPSPPPQYLLGVFWALKID